MSTSSIYASFVIYGGIGCCLQIIFEVFKTEKEIYTPKEFNKKKFITPNESLSSGFLSWIKCTYSITDKKLLGMVGMDAFIYLRFAKMLAYVFTICSLAAFVILLPIYGTAGNGQDGIQVVFMSNIPVSNSRLWAPFIMVWLFNMVFLYFIHNEYKVFADARQDYFVNPAGPDEPVQKIYSCIVENIPDKLRSQDTLFQFFDRAFPGDVHSVEFVCVTAACEELIKKREILIVKFEKAVAAYEASDRIKVPMVGLKEDGEPVTLFGGNQVEAIPYYRDYIRKLSAEITEIQQDFRAQTDGQIEASAPAPALDAQVSTSRLSSVKASFGKMKSMLSGEKTITLSRTAFVTFKTIRTQSAAAQMLTSNEYPTLKVMRAPDPVDLIWENVASDVTVSSVNGFAVAGLLWTGLLFWGVIIGFIGAISNLGNLSPYLPFVNSLPTPLYAGLSTVFPVIVLNIFLFLLPIIFNLLAVKVIKIKSLSQAQNFVLGYFHFYGLANVYFMLLAGSLFDLLSEAIANPLSIANLIGIAIPSVAIFFINVLLASWLLGVPLLLLCPGSLVVYNLYRFCINQRKLTMRDFFNGPMKPIFFVYSLGIPRLLYITTIVFLYWVIAPPVTAVAALYFASSYFALKFLFIYLYVPQFQSGGDFFYSLYGYSMYALVFASVAMIGYMGVRQGVAQTILLAILPFFIIGCWRFTEGRYRGLSQNMAAIVAAQKDGSLGVGDLDPQFYAQPALNKRTAVPTIYPYRFEDKPLLDVKSKQLDPIYHDAMHVPVNSEQVLNYDCGQAKGGTSDTSKPFNPVCIETERFESIASSEDNETNNVSQENS